MFPGWSNLEIYSLPANAFLELARRLKNDSKPHHRLPLCSASRGPSSLKRMLCGIHHHTSSSKACEPHRNLLPLVNDEFLNVPCDELLKVIKLISTAKVLVSIKFLNARRRMRYSIGFPSNTEARGCGSFFFSDCALLIPLFYSAETEGQSVAAANQLFPFSDSLCQ